MHWAAALHANGSHERAARLLREVHAAQVETFGEAHPDCLETAWRLGALLGSPGTPTADAPAAAALLRATASHQAALLGDGHPRTLRTRVSLAEALLAIPVPGADGRAGAVTDTVAEAAELLSACEAGQRAVLGEAHPEYQRTRSLAAAVHAAAAGTASESMDVADG
jgi:hypothetical protein